MCICVVMYRIHFKISKKCLVVLHKWASVPTHTAANAYMHVGDYLFISFAISWLQGHRELMCFFPMPPNLQQ